jgi:peroxiredoxin
VGLAAASAVPGARTAEGAAPARAPEFHLPLLSGGTISLADFKGRPLILLFWAPW